MERDRQASSAERAKARVEKFQRRGNVRLQSFISRDPMSVFWGGAALEALKIDIHRLDSAPCEGLFNFLMILEVLKSEFGCLASVLPMLLHPEQQVLVFEK